jgi:ABC-type phosphate/phosphonate transport system substrate-binding protein
MKLTYINKLAIATTLIISLAGCGSSSSSSSSSPSTMKITASLSPQEINTNSTSILHVVATNITESECMNPAINFSNNTIASWDQGNIDESYSDQTCTSSFTIDGNQSGTTDIVVAYEENKSTAQKLTVSDLSIHTNNSAILTLCLSH